MCMSLEPCYAKDRHRKKPLWLQAQLQPARYTVLFHPSISWVCTQGRMCALSTNMGRNSCITPSLQVSAGGGGMPTLRHAFLQGCLGLEERCESTCRANVWLRSGSLQTKGRCLFQQLCTDRLSLALSWQFSVVLTGSSNPVSPLQCMPIKQDLKSTGFSAANSERVLYPNTSQCLSDLCTLLHVCWSLNLSVFACAPLALLLIPHSSSQPDDQALCHANLLL